MNHDVDAVEEACWQRPAGPSYSHQNPALDGTPLDRKNTAAQESFQVAARVANNVNVKHFGVTTFKNDTVLTRQELTIL
jgi:hypothetical protein